ncbi:MAG: hypothetical protein NWF13_08550 [Candidatus Bathyarchaeota archaeon]|nr:hypothetical protein [Candidatus Bathyarchaeota archaeon]
MMPEEAARGIFMANLLHKTDTTPLINPDNLSHVDIHPVERTSYFIINYAIAENLITSLSFSSHFRQSLRVHGFARSVS